jgi:hypothetical protein
VTACCRSAIMTRWNQRLRRGLHERDAIMDLFRDGAGDARLDPWRVAGSG